MKLWLLIRTDRVGYDEHDSAIVRAETEEEARILASEHCYPSEAWIDVNRSTVEELVADGEKGIVLSSFNSG